MKKIGKKIVLGLSSLLIAGFVGDGYGSKASKQHGVKAPKRRNPKAYTSLSKGEQVSLGHAELEPKPAQVLKPAQLESKPALAAPKAAPSAPPKPAPVVPGLAVSEALLQSLQSKDLTAFRNKLIEAGAQIKRLLEEGKEAEAAQILKNIVSFVESVDDTIVDLMFEKIINDVEAFQKLNAFDAKTDLTKDVQGYQNSKFANKVSNDDRDFYNYDLDELRKEPEIFKSISIIHGISKFFQYKTATIEIPDDILKQLQDNVQPLDVFKGTAYSLNQGNKFTVESNLGFQYPKGVELTLDKMELFIGFTNITNEFVISIIDKLGGPFFLKVFNQNIVDAAMPEALKKLYVSREEVARLAKSLLSIENMRAKPVKGGVK